jgi:hypothetical protein
MFFVLNAVVVLMDLPRPLNFGIFHAFIARPIATVITTAHTSITHGGKTFTESWVKIAMRIKRISRRMRSVDAFRLQITSRYRL